MAARSTNTYRARQVFNDNSSRKNYNEYQQYGNHPTVAKYDAKIAKIVNKEERIKHLMAFPLWVQRFISNLHTTPQSLVVIPSKNDRLVWDGTVRLLGNSIPVNAHTKLSNEPTIHYGGAFNKHLQSI